MTAINEALMTAQELTQLDEREAHERAEAKARELLRRVRDNRARENMVRFAEVAGERPMTMNERIERLSTLLNEEL